VKTKWSTSNSPQQFLLAIALVLVALAAICGLLWPITDLMAAHDVGTITGPLRAAHLQAAREAVRTQLLTLGAGVFAAGALIFTARNLTLSRRTLDLTEQGPVTDRYTKAIEQLGSDKLDVRIGAIYALERIALDSPRDHPTAMEVLAAFIRQNSPEPLAQGSGRTSPEHIARPDVQAAATVIGRREASNDRPYAAIDLTGAKLSYTKLTRANLSRADLTCADLTGADLTAADLTDADLTGADLTGADLPGADLTGADLPAANLTRADLTAADFTDADLTDADFTDAYFHDAYLTDLFGLPATAPEGWVRDVSSGQLRRDNDEAAGELSPDG
jgi:hypothetical protein